MYIKGATLYLPEETIVGDVVIEGTTIAAIITPSHAAVTGEDVIDATGLSLIPGFIDTHIHGGYGVDVMDDTPDALSTLAQGLATEGTTAFLATTMTQANEVIEAALSRINHFEANETEAELLGVHLEGPFVEISKAGAQPEAHIQQPDINLFNRWLALSGNKIKTVTYAPENDADYRFTKHLVSLGINRSAGHTNLTFSGAEAATAEGVNRLTHLCNQMNGIHHRDIGLVGASFQLDALNAELIADGIHVSPEMMQLIVNNLTPKRLTLITDAMRAKGLSAGAYDLGGQTVYVKDGQATLKDGTLAGSVLSMIDGAKQLLALENVSLRDVIMMASVNPAKSAGVYQRKGSIESGKDADLLLVDDTLTIKATIVRGQRIIKEDLS
ncbi:N-acetylglucosamine 6-phosphate deacetylase [Streptohalobacillus salinus]|uniref:N-acetylglucosamine-6-phosphate deacetylase n=1 Tax=Streptohalobacillus salinus TaxID=621096 RepID=A0A2V3WFT8_9BACI|nr:N-acetylglucosamine-6-phosphate deacetylase [Streptohalobacillus salinus]PXW92146.1 N-acetylglucosamine 6-phosphate deacetylase [Streptohalobacillus salinus]